MSRRSSALPKKPSNKESPLPDTIIQEIRNTRDELALRFNGDLHQMCLELRREQERDGAAVVTFTTPLIHPVSPHPEKSNDLNRVASSDGLERPLLEWHMPESLIAPIQTR